MRKEKFAPSGCGAFLESGRLHVDQREGKMKFPGKRKRKHFFPVEASPRRALASALWMQDVAANRQVYTVGIDQLLVDIEVAVSEEDLASYGIGVGESVVLDDDVAEALYTELRESGRVVGEFAGGAVGNTLHNYTVLSHTRAVLLGAINRNIQVGDYAFKYLRLTSSLVDMSHLKPCKQPMGRALCFILPNGERSFGISRGCMNQLAPEDIPEDVIANASLLLLTAFLLRNKETPIYDAAMYAIELAKQHKVPIVFNLGTSFLLEEDPVFWRDFLSTHVDVVAMNETEAAVLTGHDDPLLALEAALDSCDMALLTSGPRGLYIGGHSERSALRQTDGTIYSKSIENYNQYEFSRVMARRDCQDPVKIYSHLNPYQGGPEKIQTTNGAGDAALSALLHDISANRYHRFRFPDAVKHKHPCLTYSSIAQICKYANRVSYEILAQHSPRLMYGLPEREDSLEEAYWEQ